MATFTESKHMDYSRNRELENAVDSIESFIEDLDYQLSDALAEIEKLREKRDAALRILDGITIDDVGVSEKLDDLRAKLEG